MERISLETFFTSENDTEINQYRILGGINEYSSDFDKIKIYPALSSLIELKNSLEKIINEKKSLSNKLPKIIKGFDVKEHKLIFTTNSAFELHKNIKQVFDLTEWASPHIKEAIEEVLI